MLNLFKAKASTHILFAFLFYVSIHSPFSQAMEKQATGILENIFVEEQKEWDSWKAGKIASKCTYSSCTYLIWESPWHQDIQSVKNEAIIFLMFLQL